MPNSLTSDSSPNLYPGQNLVSDNGRAMFSAQTDGNLVVYAHLGDGNDDRRALWASNTAGRSYDRVTMNGNGELCGFEYPNNGGDTIWKSGSWNSGKPGPYTLIMQDDGNLCVYASDKTCIWSTSTHVSPAPIPFSQVAFNNGSNGALCWPLVKNYNGSKTLSDGEDYWRLVQGITKTIDFNKDTTDKDNKTTFGQLIGGDGTVVSLGLFVRWGDDDWVNPFTKYQFVYKPGCGQRVTIRKWGGLRDGDASYDGSVAI